MPFKHFPKVAKCPICGGNEDGECILAGIDGTHDKDERIEQAQPIHVECIRLRYNKDMNLLYQRCQKENGGE